MKTRASAKLESAKSTITRRAVANIALLCLLLLVLAVWRARDARDEQLQNVHDNSTRVALMAAQQANDAFSLVRSTLLDLRYSIQSHPDGLAGTDREQLLQSLYLRNATLPQAASIMVMYADESMVSVPDDGDMRVPAVMEAFRYHQTHADGNIRMGRPFTQQPGQQRLIPFSIRLDRSDGDFDGVLMASLRADHFTQWYRSLNLGPGSAIAIIDNDGTVLAMQHNQPISLLDESAPLREFRSRMRGSSGQLLLQSWVDGSLHFASVQALGDYPAFVVATRSRSDVLAPWWKDTLLQIFITASLIVAVCWIGLRMVWQSAFIRRELEQQATHDGLTGLFNRRQFNVLLEREFGNYQRNRQPLALLLLDVDYFKQYNDLYGHPAGDECLRGISRAIETAMHPHPDDFVSRYGGEEFAVLLPHTDLIGAQVVAERIHASVRSQQVKHEGNPAGTITVSIGLSVALPNQRDITPELLLKQADEALYTAKQQGRNRTHCHAADAGGQRAS